MTWRDVKGQAEAEIGPKARRGRGDQEAPKCDESTIEVKCAAYEDRLASSPESEWDWNWRRCRAMAEIIRVCSVRGLDVRCAENLSNIRDVAWRTARRCVARACLYFSQRDS